MGMNLIGFGTHPLLYFVTGTQCENASLNSPILQVGKDLIQELETIQRESPCYTSQHNEFFT